MTQPIHQARALIYVIDDEEDICSLYATMLSATADVKTFTDPNLFVKEFDIPGAQVPDVIITDYRMPQMTGLQMVENVFAKGFHFPVILLSGHLDKDVVVEAVDIGVFRLLEKPTRFEVLAETIEKVLIEQDMYHIRKEIRKITKQLRELYATFRVALMHHLPEGVMDRLFVETDSSGKIQRQIGFEDLLNDLEGKLELLLNSERSLEEVRSKSYSKGKAS